MLYSVSAKAPVNAELPTYNDPVSLFSEVQTSVEYVSVGNMGSIPSECIMSSFYRSVHLNLNIRCAALMNT